MPYQRFYSADRKHWSNKYVPPRGPLAGRRYKTQANYKRALDKITGKDIEREERYNQLLQLGILQKGVPNKKSLARFKELYRKAKKSDPNFKNECPPADDIPEKDRERLVPLAVLLDFIGVRPIDEFGWICVGDTKEVKPKQDGKKGNRASHF